MKTSTYNIRLDPAVKADAEKTFEVFGLTLSEAITVFLHKSIMERGFPFDVKAEKPNTMLQSSLREADIILENPNVKGYASIDALNAAMDALDENDDI